MILLWPSGPSGFNDCTVGNDNSYNQNKFLKVTASCLAAVGDHVVGCCGGVCGGSSGGLFWSVEGSCGVLGGLRSRGFRASGLSACGFSTLYTTLPHSLVEDRLVYLIERTFQRESSLYIACSDGGAFFASDAVGDCGLWSCQKVCGALAFLWGSVYIRFGS